MTTTLGNITVNMGGGGGGGGGHSVTGTSNLVLTTGITISPSYSSSPYYIRTGVKITKGGLEIEDKDADIKLGDVSLRKFMADINLRLNMMQPNTKVEKEWKELKKLGDQYRRLEQELIEKNKVWDILKTP